MNSELFKGTEQGGPCCGSALCAITFNNWLRGQQNQQTEWVWGPLVFFPLNDCLLWFVVIGMVFYTLNNWWGGLAGNGE